ncbi:MAG: ATP-binding cassette domain-containing protein [Bacteroidales bacterium]|nr:ATP-binding cassette domain-containing protein [Bacteroidales bacterium]
MKKFSRVLAYTLPYWVPTLLNIIFNLLTVLFSLFSFALLIPFLNLLFGINELVTVRPDLHFSTKSALNYLNYYVSQIISQYGKIEALIFICGIILASFLLRNLGRFFAMYFIATTRTKSIQDIRNDIYSKLTILPLSFYSKRKKGDLMSRITTDVQEIEVSIMNYLEMIFRDPITIIAYLAFMISMSFKLTLFVLLVLPLAGLIIGLIGKSLKQQSKEVQNRFADLMALIDESISGLRIIKGFNAINYFNNKFQSDNKVYRKKLVKVYRKRDSSSPVSEFLSSIIIVIVLWFGGQMVLSSGHEIQAADFITYIVVFSQIMTPAKSLTQSYYSIQKGIASAERVFEILDADEVIEEKKNALPIKSFTKELQFDQVYFKYDTDWVLQDINLKIPTGRMIALVGESGGGKSTIVDLIPRFYDVSKGKILLDGIDIRGYKINDLRGLMGIVSQESVLFNDSVFNNIAFGMKNISQEAVEQAAKIANAHDFIIKMEDGYHTNIGDRGVKLSGGQRQRLSIARAVLADPDILILDEATSALDTESERLVQDALSKIMKNRTTLVIAHRLSTIQNADEIVVIQKGKIVERGTHKDLVRLDGFYNRLQKMQSFS